MRPGTKLSHFAPLSSERSWLVLWYIITTANGNTSVGTATRYAYVAIDCRRRGPEAVGRKWPPPTRASPRDTGEPGFHGGIVQTFKWTTRLVVGTDKKRKTFCYYFCSISLKTIRDEPFGVRRPKRPQQVGTIYIRAKIFDQNRPRKRLGLISPKKYVLIYVYYYYGHQIV